jgi:hypothetical protein
VAAQTDLKPCRENLHQEGERVTRTSFFYKGKKRRESEKEARKPLLFSPLQKEQERGSSSPHRDTSFNPRFLMLSFFALTKSNSFPYSSL